MTKFRPFWKDTSCCTSILLITEDDHRGRDFKHWLEAESCQVCRVNINNSDDLLVSCRHILFDLIVLNIDASTMTQSKEMYKTLRSLYKNLKAVPALLTLPVVVMTACDQVEAAIERLAVRPVYHIPQDASAKTLLLRTIEQIHYLTYRCV